MLDEYQPPQMERIRRNQTRRQRADTRRRQPHPTAPGGFTVSCGCRYARTGGEWVQVRPCSVACSRPFPITDEHMKQLMQA